MKAAALLVATLITQATTDDAIEKVTVPAEKMRAMVEQNQELREEVNKLDEMNDKLLDELKKQVGMVGRCT